MAIIIIGALLVVLGVVVATVSTLRRGRLSEPHPTTPDSTTDTLEPTGQGRRIGFRADLPGIALIGLGVVLLIAGGLFKSAG